ncbi:MAG: alpha/beta fold hydrolase [Jatrophihabitans sp.]
MRALGHDRFAVVGHDRGSYYALWLALDHPDRVGQENYDEWRAAMRDPAALRGMLEDYRAGLTVDDLEERRPIRRQAAAATAARPVVHPRRP